MVNNNLAKVRDCLMEVQKALIETPCAPHTKERAELIEKINGVLHEPKRNCDCYGGDTKKLNKVWWEWSGNLKNCNPDGTVKLTFGEWLLADAE